MIEKKILFLDSLKKYYSLIGCPLHSKDVGSSPVAFPFFLSFNLLVFILDFVYTWIYLFESGIRLFNKYTRRT